MMAVFLQFSPAAATVGDDKIQIKPAKDIHINAGRFFQTGQIATQHVRRAAADLIFRGNVAELRRSVLYGFGYYGGRYYDRWTPGRSFRAGASATAT